MRQQHLNPTQKTIAPSQTAIAQPLSGEIAQHSTHPIEQLQSAIGNRAVNQLLKKQPIVQAKPMFRGLSHELVVQPKLTIGAVGDKYEQEADLVAANVVSKIHAPQSPAIQREEMPEEDEKLRLSPTIQRLAENRDAIAASADLEASINQEKGRGQSISHSLRQPIENIFGADFSEVKVHTDDRSHQLNRSIQSQAFTTGQDIFFRQGEYNPGSQQGQKLLAHELTHVVQQQNRTVQAKSDLIQRVDTVQDESDNLFDYGRNFSEDTVNKQVVLKKDKTLYKTKGGDIIKNLKKGSFVEVLEQPSSDGWFSQSWAKIKVETNTGWINTKNAIDKPVSGKIIQHEPAGVIMPEGKPKVDDIKQMKFGDCFLLAALMSLVQKQPNFVKNSLFVTDPTKDVKQHTVRFFKVEIQSNSINYGIFDAFVNAKFTPERVTVNNTILKFKTKFETPSITVEEGTNVGSAGTQHWPAIVEKAFAKWPGKNQSAFNDKTSLMAGGQVQDASMSIMGQGYQNISTNDSGTGDDRRAKISSGLASNPTEAEQLIIQENRANLKAKIINTFQSKSNTLIGAGTKQHPPEEWLQINDADGAGGSGESKVGGIAFRHAYSIEDANDREIYLRNPWGRYARVRGEIEKDEAVSILTWDEFFQVFDTISLGVQ
jgi:Domain of unknown function (DUF4157)/Calpain family cysteine protease